MKYFNILALLFLLVSIPSKINSQSETNAKLIIGEAFSENQSYEFLREICDIAGGRMMGSENMKMAKKLLFEKFLTMGIDAREEFFDAPGWVRGEDKIEITRPFNKKLSAVALGYVDGEEPFEAEIVFAGYGFEDEYEEINARNKIVLVTSENPKGKSPLLRYEAIDIAASNGALGILFINDKPGALNLAGVSNFGGNPSTVPAFSITYEEGKRLQRIIERGEIPLAKVEVNSKCAEVTASNIAVTYPGKSHKKIVIGAHFDSWDLGQGAVDNGVGTAILFEVIRILKNHYSSNYYSLEFVFFDGEELGLWGSKKYVEAHKGEEIVAMINMDMTGSPTGFNVMGFDYLIPTLENIAGQLDGFDLNRGVISSPWTNSDHMPFMFEGVPTITVLARLEKEMYHYYHDAGDAFDKVSKKYLTEAAAVIASLAYHLAASEDESLKRKSKEEMIRLFQDHKLDERLKRQKEWIY